ncbi:hypothetical protein V8C35DRAFT_242033 [Trichoderma chlorosporum]
MAYSCSDGATQAGNELESPLQSSAHQDDAEERLLPRPGHTAYQSPLWGPDEPDTRGVSRPGRPGPLTQWRAMCIACLDQGGTSLTGWRVGIRDVLSPTTCHYDKTLAGNMPAMRILVGEYTQHLPLSLSSGARRCRQLSLSHRRNWPPRVFVPASIPLLISSSTSQRDERAACSARALAGFPTDGNHVFVSSASWGMPQALLCTAR